MFNVFAFLLRPPTWLYVLLTKLLFFFFPPHFFLLSLSLLVLPRTVHASTFAQSIRRSLVSLLLSITPPPPPPPLTPFLQLARAILHPRILFYHLRLPIYCLQSRKSKLTLSKRQNREIGGGKFFFENSSFSKRNMLVYGINILLEPRRRREVVKTASAKTRSTPKTRDRLESLEFTARHIGCESARN